MAYKCDRCGLTVDDAYQISRWFNGVDHMEQLCEDCIKKIGHEEEDESH